MAYDITANHLRVTHTDKQKQRVTLENISFTIQKGHFVAFIGPSGCGKTSLLRVFAGLHKQYEGHVALGELGPEQARLRRIVSFVFQQPVLLPWKTVLQNTELPLRLSGCPQKKRVAIAQHLLHTFGLEKFTHMYPHQLSLGMKQRVALVRAISFEPEILLMDEPFSALDEINREQLNTELLHIWSTTSATVLFVTHSISEAAFLADRVVVLSDHPGRMVDDVEIALPRPRTPDMLTQPDFLDHVAMLRRKLALGKEQQRAS